MKETKPISLFETDSLISEDINSDNLITPLILIGGGGHCLSCIDVIKATGLFEIKGILDNNNSKKEVGGIPVIGNDDDIPQWIEKKVSFLITVGQIKTATTRASVFKSIVGNGGIMAKVISPTAYISPMSNISSGTIVMHHAIVNAEVSIGFNCIINTASLIEHGSTVGDHCHIATGAVLNGDVSISTKTFIGSNATIIQGVNVGENTVIGAGTIVTKDIGSNRIVTNKSDGPHA